MKIFTKPYKPAQISQGKKEWYIYYSFMNPNTGKWELFKDRGGINYKANREIRRELAENLRDAYNTRLKSGWSPFGEASEEKSEYDDLKFKPIGDVLTSLLNIKKPKKDIEEDQPEKEKTGRNVRKRGERLKKRTWQSYKYSLDVFKKWLVKTNRQGMMIASLKPLQMMQFFDALSDTDYKNKSINNHKGNLSVLFNMAKKRELITANPLSDYEKLPEESGKNFPFSEQQKQDLKKKILEKDPELWPFVKFIYHLYIRPIEILRIKIIDVDLRTNHVIVHSGRGKNKKQLAVQIPDSFIDEVKAMNLEQYPATWYLFGKLPRKNKGKAGLGPSSVPYNRNSVTSRHTAIMKACYITDPDYSMYGWKHTGNIDSFTAGVELYNISRQNRHSSIEQTMTYLRSLGLQPNLDYGKKAPKL